MPKKNKNKKLKLDRWSRYCEDISSTNDIGELRGIAESTGLPTQRGDVYLTKAELCQQLSEQITPLLEGYNEVKYKHPHCKSYHRISESEADSIPESCLVRDKYNVCYYISDFVDMEGNINRDLLFNPNTGEEWNFDMESMMAKIPQCRNRVEKTNALSGEELRKKIVYNVLLGLKTGNKRMVKDLGIQVDFELDDIIEYFNDNVLGTTYYRNYTVEELSKMQEINKPIAKIAMFVSITRNLMSDASLSDYLSMYFDEVYE